jgi:hypothetical protein
MRDDPQEFMADRNRRKSMAYQQKKPSTRSRSEINYYFLPNESANAWKNVNQKSEFAQHMLKNSALKGDRNWQKRN